MQRHEFRAMGCQILAVIDRPDPALTERLLAAEGWFADWERQLSRFRPDSALARLNRDGSISQAPDALWEVVGLALRLAERSDGLLTPTILPALIAHGYDRPFDQLAGAVAPGAGLDATAGHPLVGDWRAIRLDPATRSIALPAGVALDLGGCAKGWAADQAMRRLAEAGPALVDAGGDVAISGPTAGADGTPARWPIAIADPRRPEADLALLMLRGGGVATSGSDYRRWRSEAGWQHHLIDPRTGRPADTDLLSATVIAPDVLQAEAAAKLVFLRGAAAGIAWLDQQPGCAGVAVALDGAIHPSQRYPAFLWGAAPDEVRYE
ncbi:MAG TPA: FAD:protein FMN transferase [Herpetosiphonaceae bacterium]